MLVIVTICFRFCGCANEGARHNDSFEMADLQLCAESSNFRMAETETGYYLAQNAVLYYADKSDLTAWVPVCKDPDCNHRSPTCSVQMAHLSFRLADNRLYMLRTPEKTDPAEWLYSTAADGTDLRVEYEILSSRGTSCRSFIFTSDAIYANQSAMQKDGTFHNQIIRTDGSHTEVLCTSDTPDMLMEGIYAGGGVFMRGDLTIVTSFPSPEEDPCFYLLTDSGMTAIPGLDTFSAYERMGAYLSGDTLYRFVTNDGYYRTDLTTGESVRIRDAQLTDSYAFHMTEKYIVETNLFYGFDPETPEIRIWDGTGWHSASLPDNIWPGKEAYFSPLCHFHGASFHHHRRRHDHPPVLHSPDRRNLHSDPLRRV